MCCGVFVGLALPIKAWYSLSSLPGPEGLLQTYSIDSLSGTQSQFTFSYLFGTFPLISARFVKYGTHLGEPEPSFPLSPGNFPAAFLVFQI